MSGRFEEASRKQYARPDCQFEPDPFSTRAFAAVCMNVGDGLFLQWDTIHGVIAEDPFEWLFLQHVPRLTSHHPQTAFRPGRVLQLFSHAVVRRLRGDRDLPLT